MAGPQINVQANQAALVSSIQAGITAYNQRFANQNQINLQVNARGFSQPLGRITGDVKDFESALAASNARVVAFGASTAVLGGVIRSFKEIVNVTIEVEKNLADINRVFGLSTAQLQKFSSALFEVSKATSSSFGEASKAALEFSRQGIKAEEVLQRTTDALLLAKLGGLSTANAIDALTASVNGFKNTGITTTQILNKLVAVEQNYAVGAGDLAEALSRTGQAAQEAGVNIDQLNALVTAAQEKTARGGAVIGNALKTIFTRLQRPETLDQLEAFNIKVRDIEGNVLPAITILKNFSSVYGELADTQRAALSEQVAGVYQVNILKAIVGDLNSEQSAYNGALRDGANATNEAQVAAAKLNQTLDALVSQTGTAAQQFANNIGQVTFEPLAKYTAQTFKSIFENLNDLLEGEGIGSVFANGFLKGIRNIIAGPGAIAAFYTLFKLIQNSFNFLTQALPQIAGITTESQKRKDIEASVLRILQQEGPLRQALLGYTGNQAAQAQLLLNAAKAQTAEYQQQLQIAQRLAPLLATKGVVVNPKSGQKGLAATRSSGYIPKITKMAETIGAQAGGYSPGQVVRSPVGGVMNTAEDVKYIPGFAQPFINPPAGSKAGRAHRQRSIQQTGVDPYMAAKGFIPNFAKLLDVAENPYTVKDGDTITADATIKRVRDFRLEEIDAIESGQALGTRATDLAKSFYPDSKSFSKVINAKGSAAYDRLSFISDSLSKELISQGLGVPDLRYSKDKTYQDLTLEAKEKGVGLWAFKDRVGRHNHPKAVQFLSQSKFYDPTSPYFYDTEKERKAKSYDAAVLGRKDFTAFSGYIPNFADMSMSQIAAAVRLGKMSEADARAMGWKPTSEKVAERKGRVAQEKSDKLAGISYKNIDVPWKTYDEFGGTNYDYGAAYEKHALSVLKAKYPTIQDAISAGIPGGPSSRVDALDKTTKTFFEFKGGDPTTPAELMAKFKGVRVQLVDKYRKELDTWNDVLVSNPNWGYSQGFIPNFNMGDRMRETMLKNNLRPILFDLANNTYGYSGQDGKEYLYHKDIYNNKLKTKGENINDSDFAELHNLVRGFIYPTGQIIWDYSGQQQKDLEDSKIKAKVLAKLNTAKPKLPIGKPKVLTGVQRLRMQLEAQGGASAYARGFIPNFNYQKSVMGLEERLSGNNAILDTSTGPFPFIRNSGQPNFAAAVADHGGLTQALTDSMTGQKAAGLMYDGYVPNFADFRSSGPIRQRSGRMVSNKQIDTAIDSYIKSINLLTTNNFQINAAAQQILKNYNLQGAAFNNLLKQIKAHADAERSAAQAAQQTAQAAQQAAAQRQTQVSSRYQRRFGPESGTIFQRLGGAFGGFSGRQRAGNLEGRLGGLSNNIGFQLAAPIVGGVLEEAITQGKDRSQLSTTQRFAGNAASSVITGMSTGAALGTAFGGPGIGTAIGAVIGLGNAAIQAQDSVQDLANAADQYKAQTTATLDAGKSYIEQLNQLASISDPSLLNQATYKLSETFQELNKTSPELGKKFYEASGDVEKMQTAMQEFAKNAALISNIKKLGASYKEAGDALSVIIPKRNEQLKRKGYNVETQSGEIKTTEGSLQTSFVQFQGFFDLLKEGGLSAENSAKFIEEFQKEMQGATDETTLKAIAQKYNISETVAAELAALSDNVIDEMGIEGDFFVKNSAVLVKKFYDETDKKFKTATQQAKEVQFNSRELLRKLRDGIDNYVFNIAKQIQQKEFEASRLNVLDNAASEFIDKLVTPLQAGARQAEAKIRQTSISQETERMRLSSDIAGASGKQIFETLGGGNKQVIEGLQKTVDNLQDPNLLEGTLKTLIQQTSSAQAAQQAGFKVGDPEKLATFNAQLKQQLQNTIMLSEKQKQQLEIQNLELELLNRRSEAAQVLLDLEFQLINSELERNKVLNKSVTDNQIRTAKEKAIFERPGYGFGMSPTGIQSQKANQERAALQRSQAIEREKLFSGGEDFFKSRITKAVEDLKSARLIQSKNTNPIDEITGVSNKENTKYNALQQAENKLQAFSTGQIKSVDDYKKRLEDLMGVLTPVSDTNKQIYDEVAKQLKAVNDLTEAQRSESKILNINLETQRLQALQVSLANKFYNERLETLLKTADAEQKAADALEVSLQALDTRQSRESNFYGLGVMGKAASQVDLNNQRLAIRQQQTAQQNLSGARGAVNEFATYQNEIANLKGPISLDRVKAKNAIANINTEIKNLDDAKAFADNLAKARNSLDSSSEDAKKLAGFENQVRGILQKNTSELEKQKAIQDLINKGVADEATDRTSMYQGFRSGFDNLITQGDEIGHKLGKEIPGMFADGMTNALMDVARGTKSIGDAFKDVAINFGQTLMQEVMRAAIGKALGTVGMGLFGGNQKGGLIHAQNGMYISGGRNGDRNLALLEDGEYVLNRNAVESFGGPGVLDKINYDMAPRFGSKMQGGGSFELVPEMQYNKDQEFDYTGNLMSGATNVGQIDQANYTAYAFAEDAYFKKMREKAVQDEQERVQKEFAKKQKNAQLISSIVGAVGSIALAGGMGMVAAKSAASAGAEGLKQAGAASVSSSASVATKEAFAKAQEAGGKTFAEFLKANPNDVLINGKLLANLNVANQMASGVNPLKISGGFGRFGGDAQLSNILTQQGFGPVKSGTSGLFGNIFTTGAGVVGSNVRRGRQTGGLIGFNSGGFVPYGSRLSDTIPALLTGGEYVMNNSAVKKYGLSTMNSMNSGSYQDGGSTATTNNSTNNNATNISINIDKSGKSVYGADSSSYEKQDIVLSKQMAKQINSVVLKTMSNEKRYGGELYKNPLRG